MSTTSLLWRYCGTRILKWAYYLKSMVLSRIKMSTIPKVLENLRSYSYQVLILLPPSLNFSFPFPLLLVLHFSVTHYYIFFEKCRVWSGHEENDQPKLIKYRFSCTVLVTYYTLCFFIRHTLNISFLALDIS